MSRYRPKPKLDEALEVVRRAEEAGYFDEPWAAHRARLDELRRNTQARVLRWTPEKSRESWERLTVDVEALVAALIDDPAMAKRVVNARMIRGSGRPGAKRN